VRLAANEDVCAPSWLLAVGLVLRGVQLLDLVRPVDASAKAVDSWVNSWIRANPNTDELAGGDH
jgi:hypothetical protein